MYVLDTNTLIYFFRGQGNVAAHLLALEPRHLGIPSVVVYELEVGLARSSDSTKRRRQLNSLLQAVNVLNFDRTAAEVAGTIKANLERDGLLIGPMDLLIAGTAMACSGILVTHNHREFGRLSGLRIEDWF